MGITTELKPIRLRTSTHQKVKVAGVGPVVPTMTGTLTGQVIKNHHPDIVKIAQAAPAPAIRISLLIKIGSKTELRKGLTTRPVTVDSTTITTLTHAQSPTVTNPAPPPPNPTNHWRVSSLSPKTPKQSKYKRMPCGSLETGQNTEVRQAKSTTITASQKSPSGKNLKTGLNYRPASVGPLTMQGPRIEMAGKREPLSPRPQVPNPLMSGTDIPVVVAACPPLPPLTHAPPTPPPPAPAPHKHGAAPRSTQVPPPGSTAPPRPPPASTIDTHTLPTRMAAWNRTETGLSCASSGQSLILTNATWIIASLAGTVDYRGSPWCAGVIRTVAITPLVVVADTIVMATVQGAVMIVTMAMITILITTIKALLLSMVQGIQEICHAMRMKILVRQRTWTSLQEARLRARDLTLTSVRPARALITHT